MSDKISELEKEIEFQINILKEQLLKTNKKLLTMKKRCDNISELLLRQRDRQ